jgi:hypothetical protein
MAIGSNRDAHPIFKEFVNIGQLSSLSPCGAARTPRQTRSDHGAIPLPSGRHKGRRLPRRATPRTTRGSIRFCHRRHCGRCGLRVGKMVLGRGGAWPWPVGWVRCVGKL